MTLQQIRQDFWNRSNDTSFSSSQIDLWVNLGIKQWAARADWPSLVTTATLTTTANIAEITLPTDLKRLIGARLGTISTTTEPESTELSFVNYNNKNVDFSGPGYYLNPSNDTIGLIPTPLTSGLPVYIKYFQIPADISALTDVPPFPENYHELVTFFALSRYWEGADEFDKKVHYSIEFENMIERMKMDLLKTSIGQLGRMRDIRELANDQQPQVINAVEQGL